MRYRFLAVSLAATFASAPLAHASDAIVPDEFEQQQQAVGACDAYGAGFAKLPGTNTCVRIGGQIRMEKRHSNHSSGFGSQTTFDFETRGD